MTISENAGYQAAGKCGDSRNKFATVKTQLCQLLRRAGQCEHNAERGTSSPENVTGTNTSVSFVSPSQPQRPVRKHSRMVASMTGIVKT